MNCIGWLNDTGTLVECNGYAHLDVARRICKELKIYNENENPDDTLLKHRWIRISRLIYGEHGLTFWMPRFITIEQRRFIKNIIEEGNEIISDHGKEALKEIGIDFYI